MMDFKDIEKAARDQGWRLKPIKNGIMFIPPDPTKAAVTWHGTPSDWRAVRNFFHRLRRSGLTWPWPPEKGQR